MTSKPLSMSPQLNVRHLKAGIRMVPSIAALGRKCAHALIKHGVIEKLCELLVAKHMASPLKLLSLKAVDSLLDFPQGIERFLGWTELQVRNFKIDSYTVGDKLLMYFSLRMAPPSHATKWFSTSSSTSL